MTWTKSDTEALRNGHTGRHDWERAADHIEDLERQLVEAHALSFSLGGKLDRARERIAELEREPDAITPRDLFAQAWLRNENHWQNHRDDIAKRAFEMADAMTKARGE